MLRQPIVAGSFYPENPLELRQSVESFLATGTLPAPALGVMAPHAGYVYSGAVAGETFAAVEVPDSVLLLGPNHRGVGGRRALFAQGRWQTPLGLCAIDEVLASAILQAVPQIQDDPLAHRYEHSLEVLLPFLQCCNPAVKIVPLMLRHQSFAELEAMAHALAPVLAGHPQKVLIVASSDMTHYESAAQARHQDSYALEAMLALDGEQLYRRVEAEKISMCGMVAAVVMILLSKALGGRQSQLIRYTNSGEVSGDMQQVVGYAGVVVR